MLDVIGRIDREVALIEHMLTDPDETDHAVLQARLDVLAEDRARHTAAPQRDPFARMAQPDDDDCF